MNRSLVAADDFTRQGHEITLTNTGVTITKPDGSILIHHPKPPSSSLWTLPPPEKTVLKETTQPQSINNVIKHTVQAGLTHYLSASFGNPPDSTLQRALDEKWVELPNITAKMFRQNPPHKIETGEGHLNLHRQNFRSTRPATQSVHNRIDNSNNAYSRAWEISSSDLPAEFPVTSFEGNKYVLITVFKNYIHPEGMPDKTARSYKKAYQATFNFFAKKGHTPNLHRIDNETSEIVHNYIENERNITIQYVSPGNHRTLPAERAIQTFKNHVISTIGGYHPDCPLQIWSHTLQAMEYALNQLHPYGPNPSISAYHGIMGHKYDHSRYPLHPLGSLALAFTPSDSREAWSVHGLKGFIAGPAYRHYRNQNIYVMATSSIRTTDTFDIYPTKVNLPGSTIGEIISTKLDNIPTPTTPTEAALRELRKTINDMKTRLNERVPPEGNPGNIPTPNQRVQSTTLHPLTSATTTARRRGRMTSTYSQYEINLLPTAQRRVIVEHVGQTLTDTEDDKMFQIVGIVKKDSDKTYPPVPFYKYYDILIHPHRQPTNEVDFEFTPTREFFIQRRGGAYERRPESPSSPFRWHTQINSTYHPTPGQQVLNVDKNGRQLKMGSALKSEYSREWLQESDNEFKLLIKETKTMTPRKNHEQPMNRRRDTTYYNPQVNEKLDENGNVKRRVRGTFGGNNLNYPYPTMSPTADKVLVKIHQNSVISDRRNKKLDYRYMCVDLKSFYLGSKLDRSEWMLVPTKFMSQDLISELKLEEYIHKDHILFEVTGSLYGHPAAGRISNKDLVQHLERHGYTQSANVPCLFSNKDKSITFTLIVDDIGIKYVHGNNEIDHLLNILQKPISKWDIKVDRTGSQYNGQRLTWDYDKNTLITDVPNYVKQANHELMPNKPIQKFNTPSMYEPFQYGKSQMRDTKNYKPADARGKKFVERVHGKYLWYSQHGDPTFQPSLLYMSTELANPTTRTVEAAERIVGYAEKHPNRGVHYRASDMVLKIQSDASHHGLPGSRSVAGGIFYLTDKNDPPDRLNGQIDTLCKIIDTSVCAAASESEYATLYMNGQRGCHPRVILNELGYTQPPTTIYTDNIVAKGIAHDEVTLRRSKAIHTRYHWIRDRVRQNQYNIQYLKGTKLDADFFTKPQPPIKQKHFSSRLVVPTA